MPTLLLASGSPRRRELLKWLGVPFQVVRPPDIDESRHQNETPERMAKRLALVKARAVAAKHPDSWVLGADTVVAVGTRVLGKPKDRQEARETLRLLSGRTHRVLTGVALIAPRGKKFIQHVERSDVTFRKLSSKELNRYLRTKEPYDKAGGYAIQGTAIKWVTGLKGDYFNVVGLPIDWLGQRL